MKEKLGIVLALAAIFQFSTLDAAPIDRELAILASEQAQEESQPEPKEKIDTSVPKTKKELEAEEKRLREERRAEEKRLKEEKEAARKKIEEGKHEQINPISDGRRIRQTSSDEDSLNVSEDDSDEENLDEEENEETSINKQKLDEEKNKQNSINPPTGNISGSSKELPLQSSSPTEDLVGMPNPIKSYTTFEEVADAVGFTPLYIPKKSGYTIKGILSIDDRIAEIRYGRRWEPEVSLSVRTYKRAPEEDLQDISGINGAKWRVDDNSGSTIYLAKINDNDHAAAWAVGDFTFSAYVKNLSFAAFYALVVDELIDLSNHYYIA